MVCEWGMSDKLGPLAYGQIEEEIFLGREITKHKDFSEKTAQDIDSEIKAIVMECMKRAEEVLSQNLEMLHKLSAELLEREILDADEIDKIMRGEELPPIKRIENGEDNEKDKEDVPEHVKKLLNNKTKRSSSEEKENKDDSNG
jgi:cell division protease FtsH